MRPEYEPKDPEYRQRLTHSFARQGAMGTLGISLKDFGPGWVELAFSNALEVSQQHGFVHAGVLTAAMDSACGYAAFSLMPPEAEVLTVEFKVNLTNPARAGSLLSRAWVVKNGRTLSVCQAEVVPADGGPAVALMTATMMTLRHDG